MTDYMGGAAASDSYYKLFGPADGIFQQCEEAVRDGGLPPGWAAPIYAQLPLIGRYGRAHAPVIERAAKGIIDLTVYAANRGTMTSLDDAAHALIESAAAVADPSGALEWLRAEGADRDEAMRPALALGTNIAAMLGLWAKFLRDGVPDHKPKDAAVVPVLLDFEHDGAVGTIRVFRVPDGPPGLYPDPSMMAITACNDDFRAAVRSAWEAKGIPGETILWRVDAQTDAFGGDSAGAAFALALDELRRRTARFGRVTYRRADPRYVISAALNGALGELRGVGGLARKFDAAKKAEKQYVVLAEQNRAEVETNDAISASGLAVLYAKNLNEAIGLTRRLNPAFVRATVAAALVVLLAIGGSIFAANKIGDANRRANVGKLLSTVSTLKNLAQQTETTTLPDLQAKAQYLLTAHVLALQAGRPDLADQIAATNLRTSPGIMRTLDADLGVIRGIYNVGGGTVVTSDKGKIVLVDNFDSVVLGTYTLPPGTETLNQPSVKALAAAPHTLNFATVSQVPVTGPAGTEASLEIFSAGGKLTLIGRSSGFTSDQVRELSYSPGGDALIAVTATHAYFWDASSAAPRLTGSCALPHHATMVPVALFPDPKSALPLIVESDSSVQSLASWRLDETGSACAVSQVTPAWAGKVAAPQDGAQLTPPTITAGASTSDGAMISAITSDGQVKVRLLATGRVVTLPIGAPATYVSGPYDGYVAVQVQAKGGTALQVWNWNVGASGKPTREVSYPGLRLPGSFPGGTDFATSQSGHIVDELNDQDMTYPTGLLTFSYRASYGTAAGQDSFAVVGPRDVAVYSFAQGKAPVYLSMPDGYNLATGDNRFDNSVTMSQDGRYVAMILNPGAAFGQKTTSVARKVVVWNVATGYSTDLTAKFGEPTASHQPTDIRFAGSGDDFLVNYTDGVVAEARVAADGWHASDLIRSSSPVFWFGMEAGSGGIYLIERRTPAGSATSDDRVLRFSYSGTLLKAWDFSSRHINAPSIVALSDGGVLLIDNGGTAYRLRPDGTTGKPVDLNVQAVLEARQIPGTQQVLIASQGEAETYDLAHDILATGASVGGSAQGVWIDFAITTDGRYLIGSDLLDYRMALGTLKPPDRLANLCDIAGGSGMSKQAWATYVGNLAPYTDPCAQGTSTIAAAYDMVRQGEFSLSPQLVESPAATSASALASACRDPQAAGYNVAGEFAWGNAHGTEAICVKGTLKWVVPNPGSDVFQAGTVSGTAVLTVTGKITPATGSTDNTAVDVLAPTGVADSTDVTNGTTSITPAGVTVSGTAGAIRVNDTFGPDQHYHYWYLESVVPDGLAAASSP